MICPNCENKIPDKAKVCGYCGHRLKAGAPVQGTISQPVSSQRGMPVWAWGLIGGLVVFLGIAIFTVANLRRENAQEPPPPTTLPPAIIPTQVPLRPTATPILPTPTPELFKVFWAFDDDISETEFYEWESEACSFNFNSGEYHIVVKAANLQCLPTTDFTLGGDGYSYVETKARIVEEIAYWQYGLIFGFNDMDNYYGFKIDSDREYRLEREINGERETLIDWTQSGYVNSGNATNDLYVWFTDTQIELYINGHRVDSYSDDDRMPAGGVGVIVGAYESLNVHVAFDFFSAGEGP